MSEILTPVIARQDSGKIPNHLGRLKVGNRLKMLTNISTLPEQMPQVVILNIFFFI